MRKASHDRSSGSGECSGHRRRRASGSTSVPGISFGFCGSGFSISSGFQYRKTTATGTGGYGGYGYRHGYYRPEHRVVRRRVTAAGIRPRYRSNYRGWDNGMPGSYQSASESTDVSGATAGPMPRSRHRSRAAMSSRHTIREPNRAPEIKDEVSVEERGPRTPGSCSNKVKRTGRRASLLWLL